VCSSAINYTISYKSIVDIMPELFAANLKLL